MQSILHLDLNTGQSKTIYRVSDPTRVEMAAQDLAEAVSCGSGAVSDQPNYRLTVPRHLFGLATIDSLETGPVVRLAAGFTKSSSHALWRFLGLPDNPPVEPWCAARLLDGAFFEPECVVWLSQYELQLIWAMVDRWSI
jgi:hypothetical protein